MWEKSQLYIGSYALIDIWPMFFSPWPVSTVVSGLSVSLPSLLMSTSFSAADRKEQLNAVKMSVYLLCKLTENLESDSYRQGIVTALGKVWLLVGMHQYHFFPADDNPES